MTRRIVVTIVLLAGCWAAWTLAGAALEAAGFDDIDLPLRVCAVFGFLGIAEAVLPRIGFGRADA